MVFPNREEYLIFVVENKYQEMQRVLPPTELTIA